HTRSYGDWSSDVCSSDLNSLLIIEKHYDTLRYALLELKQLYWALSYLAVGGGASMPFPRFLLWLSSRDAFARAARLGVKDYLRRSEERRVGKGWTSVSAT